jgi:hypothetical protein
MPCNFLYCFIWLEVRTSGGSFEHGNEPSVSIKDGKFFDKLSEFYRLKNDSASLC